MASENPSKPTVSELRAARNILRSAGSVIKADAKFRVWSHPSILEEVSPEMLSVIVEYLNSGSELTFEQWLDG